MSVVSQRFVFLIAGFLALGGVGCPGPAPANKDHEQVAETVIKGSAPLNAGGAIRATAHGGYRAGTPYEGQNKEDGSFVLKASGASGKFTLEAVGGSYVEPANGTRVPHGGEQLHAVADVKQLEVNEVAITPWTEIAYVRGGVDGYDEVLKTFTDMLICPGGTHARLLRAVPASPSSGIQSVSTDALAYLYMGGFSQLAHDLSEAHAVQTGARITSMSLARSLAEDFSDGKIDGKNKDGDTVYMIDDVALPPDLLRQQFAQSVRRFLKLKKPTNDPKPWGNESTLGETAMRGFLSCICDSRDPALGPTISGALDLDGPALSIVTPAPSSYLAASQDVVCEANDPSGVVSLGAVFIDDSNNVVPHALGFTSSTAGQGTTRRFVAPLRIERLTTGRVRVLCDATDKWGNSNTLMEPLYVNKGGIPPELVVDEAMDGNNVLCGRATITCDCTKDPYSTDCALKATVAGVDVTQDLEVMEADTRKNTYAWTTAEVLDGTGELKCTNTTRGLPQPIVSSKSVRLKNREDGTARGTVYLDTRVLGMQVTAFAYKDGIRGDRLGGGELNGSGDFEFALSTEYRGPVLFVAEYASSPSKMATYHNVPLDDANMTTSSVLKLVDQYEPGEEMSGLSINVGSSMHEALAVALLNTGTEPTFEAAIRRAYDAVSLYFSVGTGRALDPRRTSVADLTKTDRRSSDQEVMGLFHVGLSRLALDRSLEKCRYDRQLTIDDIVVAMRKDLSDGVLDGKEHGTQIYMACDVPITPDFFRIDLARAIRRWVDRSGYPGGKIGPVPVNKSGLTKNSVTSRAPVVQGLANNSSPLFNGRPGENFDGNSPTIWFKVYGPDDPQRELDLSKPVGNTTLRLVVRTTHQTSEVIGLSVTLNGEEQDKRGFSGDVASGEYIISTAALSGPQNVVIKAMDAQHSEPAIQPILFTVDRIVPIVTLDGREVWINDGNAYRLKGTVAKKGVTAKVTVNEVAVGTPLRFEDNALTLALPLDCNARHEVKIEVTDDAGNRQSGTQTVYCDGVAPKIAHQPSAHMHAQNGNVVSLEHRAVEYAQDGAGVLLQEKHGKGKRLELLAVETAPLLEVVWSSLDGEKAYDDGRTYAPPTLNFSVRDPGEISTSAETLVGRNLVTYKYIFTGKNERAFETEWRAVKCSLEGACALPFTYEAMLTDAVRNLPLTQAREQNFIARAAEGERHTVLIKVEDLAGNTTMSEWSFRLKFFTPPVMLECEHKIHDESRLWPSTNQSTFLQQSKLSWLTANQAQVPFAVRAKTNLGSDDNHSLTPADGSHQFAFPNASVEWRIDKTWRICQNQRPHSRQGSGFVMSQSITPREQQVELHAGNERVHNPLVARQRVEFPMPGYTAYLSTGMYNGRIYPKVEYEPASSFDSCFVIMDMRQIRRAYRVEYKGSRTKSPPPVRIDAGSCAEEFTTSWREDHAPVFHLGKAPDLNDVESFYN